jgi:hypothetical protein
MTLALAWTGVTRAQSPDDKDKAYLDQIRRLNEVRAQKAEAEYHEAIQAAQRLALKDPAQAVDGLKATLALVKEDPSLTDSRRDKLLRKLNEQIRIQEAAVRTSQRDNPPLPAPPRRPERKPRASDDVEVSSSLATIRSLLRDGQTEKARQLGEDLARKYPQNLAAQSARHLTVTSDQSGYLRRQRHEEDARMVSANRDVERSNLPASGDVEFPQDWVEKTKKRSTVIKLTEKEKVIVKALRSPLKAEFKNANFGTVLEYLRTMSKLEIIEDTTAMQLAQVSYDTPVTLNFNRPVALQTVLRSFLGGLNLNYVIKDETLQITSAERAKELMVTRSYYIGDLIAVPLPVNNFPYFAWGQAATVIQGAQPPNALQILQQAKQIADMIKESVDPGSWREDGASITFNAATMSLVVRNSAAVHALLGSSMGL